MPFKDKKIGIYKIKNIKNDKVYIGSAINIYRRFVTHKHLLRNNKHFNTHLQSSWNKYNSDNFIFEIVEECEKSLLENREEFYIK